MALPSALSCSRAVCCVHVLVVRLALGVCSDLFVSNEGYIPNELFQNLDGVFTLVETPNSLVTGSTGKFTRMVRWGDLDNDGDLDAIAHMTIASSGSDYGQPSMVHRNDGSGAFVKAQGSSVSFISSTVWARSVAFADYDLDGDLDLLMGTASGGNQLHRVRVTRRIVALLPPADRLVRPTLRVQNDGGGSFTPVGGTSISLSSVHAWTASWADVNGDGWPDAFFSTGGGVHSAAGFPNELHANHRDGTFRAVDGGSITARIGKTTCVAWGDVNGDGWVDVVLGKTHLRASGSSPGTGANTAANGLHLNPGNGGFAFTESVGAISQDTTTSTSALAFGDIDGDSDLDLVSSAPGSNCQLL